MIRIRRARLRDNDALIDIERRSPLQLGAVEVIIEHTPDFFAQKRLQNHPHVLVAEEHGRPIAHISGAWYEARFGRSWRRLLCVHRQRIPPEYQRRGLGTALATELLRRCRRYGATSACWLIDPANKRSMAFGQRPGAPIDLVTTAPRFFIDTAASGPAAVLQPLRPDQTKEAVDLINRTHGHLDLFTPYTPARFSRRLSRSPEYTREHLFGLTENGRLTAVLGLWDQGRNLRVTRREPAAGPETIFSRAVVADYGYGPGAEEAMLALLQAAVGRAWAWGRQELMIAAAPSIPFHDRLTESGARNNPISFLLIGDARADAGADIWLDPIYL